MEIAGFVVALLAVIAAGASALYARGANVRADDANKTAAAAVDLQSRVDARQREFRDVTWTGRWVEEVTRDVYFLLRNDGLTVAREVTLILSNGGLRTSHKFAEVEPGAERRIEVDGRVWTDQEGQQHVDQRVFDDTRWRVHWSSPLGQVNAQDEAGIQLY